MLQDFQTHLITVNYFWLVGAVLFGFLAGRIFHRGTPILAVLGYVGFVLPTMKFGDIVQSLGFTASFNHAANGWGLTPWDLSSALVAAIVVIITGVFWALNQ